jgi:hypothetical protein
VEVGFLTLNSSINFHMFCECIFIVSSYLATCRTLRIVVLLSQSFVFTTLCSERLGRALFVLYILIFWLLILLFKTIGRDDATSWNGYTCSSLSSSSQTQSVKSATLQIFSALQSVALVWREF